MGKRRFVFRPLAKAGELRYTFHEDYYDLFEMYRHSRYNAVSTHLGKFATLGDGDVQHDTEFCVQDGDLPDYAASLAVAVADPVGGLGLAEAFWSAYHFTASDVVAERVLNLAKVRHDPDRRSWFSTKTGKQSFSAGRATDRRWEEVPSYANGSVRAVFGLYSTGDRAHDRMAAMMRFEVVRMVLDGAGLAWGEHLGQAFGEKLEPDAQRALRDAVETLRMVADLGGAWRRIRTFAERKAESAEAAAAS